MPNDLKELLHRSAALPSTEPDIERALRRGRRLRNLQRVTMSSLAVVVIGLGSWVGLQQFGQESTRPRVSRFNNGNSFVGTAPEGDARVLASGEHEGQAWRLQAYPADGKSCLQFSFESWDDAQRLCIPPEAAPNEAIGAGSMSLGNDDEPPFIWGVLSQDVARVVGTFSGQRMELTIYETPDELPVPLQVFIGFPDQISRPSELQAYDAGGNPLQKKELGISRHQ